MLFNEIILIFNSIQNYQLLRYEAITENMYRCSLLPNSPTICDFSRNVKTAKTNSFYIFSNKIFAVVKIVYKTEYQYVLQKTNCSSHCNLDLIFFFKCGRFSWKQFQWFGRLNIECGIFRIAVILIQDILLKIFSILNKVKISIHPLDQFAWAHFEGIY